MCSLISNVHADYTLSFFFRFLLCLDPVKARAELSVLPTLTHIYLLAEFVQLVPTKC